MIGPYEFPPKFIWTNGALVHRVLFPALAGFKKALRGVSVEAPKPDSGFGASGRSLKTLRSLNKEVRPFFLGDNIL